MLKVGDKAPDFTARTSERRLFRLSTLLGGWVVLYFYPKAFTPRCTKEARMFRDNHEDLAALGASVVGVSIDSLETQCRFAEAEKVPFPLIADEDKAISRSYGVMFPLVPVDKRVTFMIDPEGVIRAVFFHQFQVSKHLDDVVAFLKKLRPTAS
jgi:thioredoxin-dependent peroxiredoxin